MFKRGSHLTKFREIWCRGLPQECVAKLKIWLKSDNNARHLTWKPKYLWILDSSINYSYLAFRQQCKADLFLSFQCKAWRFYSAESYMQVYKNTKGNHYCVDITIFTRTHHDITIHVHCQSCSSSPYVRHGPSTTNYLTEHSPCTG